MLNKALNSRLTWLVGLLAFAGTAMADYGLNMTEGVTPFSAEVYELHMIILWICVVIGIGVFGAMFYSMYAHRKSRGVEPAQFSHSTLAEVLWTVVPIAILVVMAIPATRVLIFMEQTTDAEMTVKITGYQWKWKYEYMEDGVEFISSLHPDSNAARQVGSDIDPATVENYLLEVDKPLVLPTNTKVRFLITSDDVIHAWWVPALGWKRDAIPGFINEAWTEINEPGIYRGQCAELCGKDHGFMPIVVVAKSPEDYAAWVAEQQGDAVAETEAAQREWSFDELMDRGSDVYAAQCAACHKPDGTGLPPAFPSLVNSEVATGPIDAHIDLVVNGREGTAMQAFGNLLSDVDVAAALTYTRNAFGNETGDAVQPKQIADAKRG